MQPTLTLAFALAAMAESAAAATPAITPARAAVEGCQWEKRSDAEIGLESWVQRCDFGFRKIDFLVVKKSLAIRYSDGGGEPDPLVDVIDLLGDESVEDGLRRTFAANTDAAVAKRCVLAPYKGYGARAPAGVKRYTFVPDKAYAKELEKTQNPDEIGEPPCGELGDAPDGIQYFEAHPSSAVRKFLFVRIGQDDPLFDETSLKLLPAPANTK